jgi:hypothetical protein
MEYDRGVRRILPIVAALLAHAGAARAERVQLGFGATLGESLQTDAYVAGARMAMRHTAIPFLELDAGALAGIGADFWSLRPGAHLNAVLRFGRFRMHALFGASVLLYRPRGDFAEFCDKTGIDCDSSEAGFDVGIGAGWRGLGGEVVIGTGNLPLFTFLFTGRLWL